MNLRAKIRVAEIKTKVHGNIETAGTETVPKRWVGKGLVESVSGLCI